MVACADLLGSVFGSDTAVDQDFQKVLHYFPLVFSASEADLVIVILSLIDMALVVGLLIMVMFSGYENFISQIDTEEGAEKLAWLGKLDAGSLKQ